MIRALVLLVALLALGAAAPVAAPTPLPSAKPTSAPSPAPSPAPSLAPNTVPGKPVAAPTPLPSAKPTSAPSPAPSPVPTLSPNTVASPKAPPSAAPSALPSAKPTAAPTKAPSGPVAPTVAPPIATPIPNVTPTPPKVNYPIIQSIPPNGYWVKNGWQRSNPECSGSPDYQQIQALGQCYVITTMVGGAATYQSYSYVMQSQDTVGGLKSQAVYKVTYRDAVCKVAFMSTPVALVVPGLCEDQDDANMPGSSGGSNTYFVSQYISMGPVPPSPTITGVQHMFFANQNDCLATHPLYSYMSVLGPNFCVKSSTHPSATAAATISSRTYACISPPPVITSSYWSTNGQCDNTQGTPTTDTSNKLIQATNCQSFSLTDSSKYIQTVTCVTNTVPPPSPTPYVANTPTTAPTKTPGQYAVGYWATQYFTGNKCSGDPYVTDYVTLGLCTPVLDDDPSVPGGGPTKYIMTDLTIDDISYTLWEYYYSDPLCVQRIKGFPTVSIRNFQNGRCIYNQVSQTSKISQFIQGVTPPTSPGAITYPAIVRDVYASKTSCSNVLTKTIGPGNFPIRGEIYACGVCAPLFANQANGATKPSTWYMYYCSKSDPNNNGNPSISFSNYTNPQCQPSVSGSSSSTPIVSVAISAPDVCRSANTPFIANAPNVPIDSGTAKFAYDVISCLTGQRPPTALPTTAPTSASSVVKFNVKQQLDGVPFFAVESNLNAYRKAIVDSIAEAMSISINSVKDLLISPGSNRRRALRSESSDSSSWMQELWTRSFGIAPSSRRRLDVPPAAPPAGTADNPGKSSIIITYIIDTNIGKATVKGVENTLIQAVNSGALDAIMASKANSNTSALANVQCSMPQFSGEVYNPPTVPKSPGLPAYAIALISISVAVILCGGAYAAYYVHHEMNKGAATEWEKQKAQQQQQLVPGGGQSRSDYAGDSAEASDGPQVEVEIKRRPKPEGDEQIDSYGANPYAGQIPRAPRRVSVAPSISHDEI